MRESRKSGRPRSSGFLFWFLIVLVAAAPCASRLGTGVYQYKLRVGRQMRSGKVIRL